ncbi:hypothetical protein R3X26_17410 [Vibrio sp. TH_r3]|uniref:hypothetical protein n=1 Tax=Vibrio sp. TH_r3 TaxID=3082084 RepID=UPI0029557BAA|nr:hypothetical protein [Vibrio sp. TH_r3]MDV7106176.1 hypothetical protein [Vibrio sp. TH_r3]
MKDSIISMLKQQLEVAGIDTLDLSNKEAELFARAIEQKADIFANICQNNPEKDPKLLLLGLLTKLQIEATARLETQAEQISKMNNVFEATIGETQTHKFTAESVIELSLVTKLWLMVQGYLNMDFSLANDYATNTSLLLVKTLHSHDTEELRTKLLASYYHGKEKQKVDTPVTQWSDKLFNWFKGS